jgi:autotransporter-associated beta strand protein
MGTASDTIAQLILGGGAVTGTGTLTSTANITGTSGSSSAPLGGTNGLSRTGAGTLTLSGTNVYTGATTVTDGKLVVNGSTASGSAVSVRDRAGVLGGSGTVNGTVSVAEWRHDRPRQQPWSASNGQFQRRGWRHLERRTERHRCWHRLRPGRRDGDSHVHRAAPCWSFHWVSVQPSAIRLLSSKTIRPTPCSGTLTYGSNTLIEGEVFSVSSNSFTADFQISYQGGDGNDVTLTQINTAEPTYVGTPGNDSLTVDFSGTELVPPKRYSH